MQKKYESCIERHQKSVEDFKKLTTEKIQNLTKKDQTKKKIIQEYNIKINVLNQKYNDEVKALVHTLETKKKELGKKQSQIQEIENEVEKLRIEVAVDIDEYNKLVVYYYRQKEDDES